MTRWRPWLLALALLTGTDPAGAVDTPALLPVDEAFALDQQAQGEARLLHWRIAPGYYLYRHRIRILPAAGTLALAEGEPHQDPFFGAVQTYRDHARARWTPTPAQDPGQAPATQLQIEYQGCADIGICYPPQRRTLSLAAAAGNDEAVAATGHAATGNTDDDEQALRDRGTRPSLWLALALALLGGLVLNLMPCVLPVLSLKVLTLGSSGGDRARARAQALAYTAGVLTTFLLLGGGLLALRALGHGVGWGAQLQQPAIVAALAYLMVAMALGLSGVYTPSGRLAAAGQQLASRPGLSGEFFTGVLACVVASPCVAPFMGTALAYAFLAPPTLALLVFAVLGLGVALPFLLIGLVPALSRWLPRPGPWMQTLKQVLAFPLYLSAAWLLWVLGKQRGVDALALILAGSIVLACALWWFERSRWHGRRWALTLAAATGLLALSPLLWLTQLPVPTPVLVAGSDEAWSAARLQQLRAAQRTVFVNVTADWCVTCKANEQAMLHTAAFRQLLHEHDAVALRADWTNGDPAISRFLQQHGAVGVPLYAVYHPGRPPQLIGGLLDRQRLARLLTAPP